MNDQPSKIDSINFFSQALTQAQHFDEQLRHILDTTLKMFKVDAGIIRTFEEETGDLVLKAHMGISFQDRIPEKFRGTPGHGRVWECVQTGRPMITGRSPDSPLRFEKAVEMPEALIVPLQSKGRLMGSMSLFSDTRGRFKEDDFDIFASIGNQAGTIIENAQLFTQVEQRTEALAVLHDISQIVNGSLDLDQVFNDALEKVIEVFKADAGMIQFLEQDTQEMVIRVCKGISLQDIGESHIRRRAGKGIVWECAKGGEPLLITIPPGAPGLLRDVGMESAVMIPLMAKGRTMGTMSFFQRSSRDFSTADMKLFSNIGSQIGGAIENACLFTETQQHTKGLSMLSAVSETVNQSLDLDKIINDTLEKVMALFEPYTAFIRILDQDTNESVFTSQKGLSSEDLKKVTLRRKIGEGTSSITKKSGKVLVVEDISTHPLTANRQGFAKRIGCRSYVSIPLKSKKNYLGNMGVLYRESRSFTDKDIQLFTSIGHQIGTAIENANLFTQVEQRNRILNTLNTVSQTVSRTLDLDLVLNDTLDTILEVLKVDAGLIRLFEEETQELVIKAHKGLSEQDIEKAVHRRKAGEGSAWHCVKLGKPFVKNNLTANASSFRNRIGMPVFAMIPLMSKDRLMGTMSIYQRYLRDFSTEDIELFSNIGNQVGVAIDNARLYQEEEHSITALKEAQKKLEKSNANLEDFAYIVSHDLQEPLRKVQAFGDRLKRKCADGLSEVGRDYLERMQSASKRMSVLINDLLMYSRVSTKTHPFVPVDLGEICREILSDLEIRIDQLRARVEVGEFPTLQADPLHMRQLLQNLIGNAIKFRREDIPPIVKVYSRIPASNGFCEIYVEDNGIGFEEKYANRIFGVFQRLHGRNAYEGTGVGLAICQKIVDRHKGRITAKSENGKGATFIIALPFKQSPEKPETTDSENLLNSDCAIGALERVEKLQRNAKLERI